MRSILVLLVSVLYLILTLPVLLILELIGKKRPDVRDRTAQAMIRWIFRVHIFLAGTKLTVIGRDRIPENTAVLYAGNHRSIFDIILTYNQVRGTTGYIAKKSLSRIPLFSNWARCIGCLFFDRSDIREGMRMIRDGCGMIKSGKSVFLFPEGTRGKSEDELPLLPFHEGGFRIASQTKAPVVPVAICNTADIWEAHFPWIRKKHVIIEFCDPIQTADMTRAEKKNIGHLVSKIITEKLENNKYCI